MKECLKNYLSTLFNVMNKDGGISVGIGVTNDRRGNISGNINLQGAFSNEIEEIPLNITYNFDDMPTIDEVLNDIKSVEMNTVVTDLISNNGIEVFSVAKNILEIDTKDTLKTDEVKNLVSAIESVASGKATVRQEGKYTFISYKLKIGTSLASNTLKDKRNSDYMTVTLRVNENQKSIVNAVFYKDKYEAIRKTVKSNIETLKVNEDTTNESIYHHVIQNINMDSEDTDYTADTGHMIVVGIDYNYDNKIKGHVMFWDKNDNYKSDEIIYFEKEYTMPDSSDDTSDKDDNVVIKPEQKPETKPETPDNTVETENEKLDRIYKELIEKAVNNLDKLESFNLNEDTKRADILKYVTSGIEMVEKDNLLSDEGLYTKEGNIYVNVVYSNDGKGNIEVQAQFRKDVSSEVYIIENRKYKYEYQPEVNNPGSVEDDNSSSGSGNDSSSENGSGSAPGSNENNSSGNNDGSSSGSNGGSSGGGSSSGGGGGSSLGGGSGTSSSENSSESESSGTTIDNSNDESKDTLSDSNEEKVHTWIKNDDGTWKLNVDGQDAAGWQKLNDTWYLFDDNNIMKTGWQKVNDTWYHLENSGAMTKGWLKDANGKWYYLHGSGEMKTGWLKDSDGKWYFLKSNGEMAINETIEGYYLGINGAWIK